MSTIIRFVKYPTVFGKYDSFSDKEDFMKPVDFNNLSSYLECLNDFMNHPHTDMFKTAWEFYSYSNHIDFLPDGDTKGKMMPFYGVSTILPEGMLREDVTNDNRISIMGFFDDMICLVNGFFLISWLSNKLGFDKDSRAEYHIISQYKIRDLLNDALTIQAYVNNNCMKDGWEKEYFELCNEVFPDSDTNYMDSKFSTAIYYLIKSCEYILKTVDFEKYQIYVEIC